MKWTNTLTLLLTFITSSHANTEKVIFLGPDPVRVPSQHPTFSDLHLDTLTPQNWSLRTALSAEFPNATHPSGKATWLLLEDLTQDQRYEVRVSWAATQPTSFTIKTYTLETVFSTPNLITSLNEYSATRQQQSSPPPPPSSPEKQSSLLLLQILTASDFVTTDQTLMNQPSPVDVDIMLDPFLLNVLPRSLIPTILYIAVVAFAGYFVSKQVTSFFAALLRPGGNQLHLEEDKKTN